jgi:glycosyltransferase involved in cell wall biosynthesis
MPYKNVETLIKGMRWLPGRTLHLLSKITDERKAELKAKIPRSTDVIFHNGVTDETYAKLLADKAVLVTASFDEGYGLPIAEALAMGVPAVISDISIFHEVAAGGALYFDPNDPQQFANRVLELDDKILREHLVDVGKKHIGTFSWESSARTLLNAVKSLI